jgi:hypothetical protein
MATPQWVKKLGGHAGELYVAAELSKRGIPNALLPENFSDDDIMVGSKDGSQVCFIQVKSCHPDRSSTFILNADHEAWVEAKPNEFVVFVWLGSPSKNESPRYWIASKAEVGIACKAHPASGTSNWERRFTMRGEAVNKLKPEWENNWTVFLLYSYIAENTNSQIAAVAVP